MVKEALVVKRDLLFKDKHFEGFMPADNFDYSSIILKNYFYHERGDQLEHDQSLQQIIPYVVIINTEEKKIFAYRRAANEKYTEVRLRNKWSIGLGGHIEREDSKDPIVEGMMRELKEEVKMSDYPIPKIIGYLNDDKGDVESVHFGVAALVETVDSVEKGDEEMAEGRFYSLDEFESLISNPDNELEGWSRIVWPEIKKYLF